jgi:hypothetical protein
MWKSSCFLDVSLSVFRAFSYRRSTLRHPRTTSYSERDVMTLLWLFFSSRSLDDLFHLIFTRKMERATLRETSQHTPHDPVAGRYWTIILWHRNRMQNTHQTFPIGKPRRGVVRLEIYIAFHLFHSVHERIRAAVLLLTGNNRTWNFGPHIGSNKVLYVIQGWSRKSSPPSVLQASLWYSLWR